MVEHGEKSMAVDMPMSSPSPSPKSSMGVEEMRLWAYKCVDGLTARCDEINELNVFPIADSDTGTNLVFTIRAAVESMRTAGADADIAAVAAALAQGAIAGARGNSGVIVSQLLRALAEVSADGEFDGAALTRALVRAADLVVDVVSVPVDGTIVSVLGSSARAVADLGQPCDIAAVARCAAESAAVALDRTRHQLPALRAAGVVDAGALGLLVMLDALCGVVTGVEPPPRQRYHRQVTTETSRAVTPGSKNRVDSVQVGEAIVGYEVLYQLSGIDEAAAIELRRALTEIGDSVVVAGDGNGSWSAHVHTANAGLAVDIGICAGRIHGVRIAAFGAGENCDTATSAPGDSGEVFGREILAVVAGDGAEQLYLAEGAHVLRCDTTDIGPAQLCAAIVGSWHTEVLVLPNGALSAQELVAVSVASRNAGKDVLMLPSSSMVQGLAALAVHDPTKEGVDDAFTMSEAAAGTRWASVRIAEVRALTWVGTCEPGDGLGLVGREVVVIGSDAITAGCNLLDQLLSAGGEMVTVLLGESADAEFGQRLAEYVAEHHPVVEFVTYRGGQPGDMAQLGVE
ncbi:DAK2 domain-containing protein [Rhodococcus sp. H29-C3]|uniref:DAK2 domain-containing protein n=1 Tax=Rhodococcus sp. H29-C3 TaxID=3046307 RepID=UPI0032D59A27